jgi:hypothetical protein
MEIDCWVNEEELKAVVERGEERLSARDPLTRPNVYSKYKHQFE